MWSPRRQALVPIAAPARPRVTLASLGIATVQAVIITAALMWLLAIVHERYWPAVAIDLGVGPRCLDPRFYLVDARDKRVGRGDYVVFRARGMGPFFADGTLVVKRITGISGDHVVVDEQGVWVNGVREGGLLHAQEGGKLWALGHRVGDYARDERVPFNHWWVMGTNPRSFDSRYWGYVDNEQIVGRARPIW